MSPTQELTLPTATATMSIQSSSQQRGPLKMSESADGMVVAATIAMTATVVDSSSTITGGVFSSSMKDNTSSSSSLGHGGYHSSSSNSISSPSRQLHHPESFTSSNISSSSSSQHQSSPSSPSAGAVSTASPSPTTRRTRSGTYIPTPLAYSPYILYILILNTLLYKYRPLTIFSPLRLPHFSCCCCCCVYVGSRNLTNTSSVLGEEGSISQLGKDPTSHQPHHQHPSQHPPQLTQDNTDTFPMECDELQL